MDAWPEDLEKALRDLEAVGKQVDLYPLPVKALFIPGAICDVSDRNAEVTRGFDDPGMSTMNYQPETSGPTKVIARIGDFGGPRLHYRKVPRNQENNGHGLKQLLIVGVDIDVARYSRSFDVSPICAIVPTVPLDRVPLTDTPFEQFMSDYRRELCRLLGIKQKLTTPCHPMCNSLSPYRVPCSLRQTCDELEQMEKLGIIRKSNHSYASPVVVVEKKDDSNRTCIDYRLPAGPGAKSLVVPVALTCCWSSVVQGMIMTDGPDTAETRPGTTDMSCPTSKGWRMYKYLDLEGLVSASDFRGQGGPLRVSKNKPSLLAEKIVQAGKDLGFPDNNDYNGKSMEGIFHVQNNAMNGKRMSSSRAYLHPAMDRPNLDVAVNSHVQKVIIKDKRATGVEVIRNGRKLTINARKEVILSAGAIGSPHVLLLSGVGPKKQLEDLHIPVAANLPVGENLQDHLLTHVGLGITEPISYRIKDFESLWSMIQYYLFGTGKEEEEQEEEKEEEEVEEEEKKDDEEEEDMHIVIFSIP
ncbi:oxygen-dependent choline dehydrogenase [Plakobranchus ocellatus]|uniref:Oxygen-dependent choline dehydrogenase n=1 Tax=Plakobranchus ocellatus TaxID=259542 RepID=A0AAV3ZW51_9GAST|nr:oxygen-dependent choline dehydrogenase [Plakobranchus ocellatus]